MATLQIIAGPQLGEFLLKGPRSRISREPGADISLPSQMVSRNHAQIVCVKGEYFIEDLGSSNALTVAEPMPSPMIGPFCWACLML